MLEPNVLFEEFRFRSALAQTQIELLEDKVQEFRSFVKEAEERLERIHRRSQGRYSKELVQLQWGGDLRAG